jgi:hypothetical protein
MPKPAFWSTVPSRQLAASPPWWKRQLGEACPHGCEIFLVSGTHVRNAFDSDFDQGGNGFAYGFIPKDEIWIDDHVPEIEWPFVAFHECHEIEDMRRGMPYAKAHERAKRLEDRERRHLQPGEP